MRQNLCYLGAPLFVNRHSPGVEMDISGDDEDYRKLREEKITVGYQTLFDRQMK